MFETFKTKDPEKVNRDHESRMTREQLAGRSAEELNDQIGLAQQDGRQDLIKWQQELSDELDEFSNNLRNKVWDEHSRKWVSKTDYKRDKNGMAVFKPDGTPEIIKVPPLMNELGVNALQGYIRPFLSRNLINSNLSEDQALGLLLNTSNDLSGDIAYNHEIYEMNEQELTKIMRLFKNYAIPAPFRAINGWNKKMDTTMSKRVESFTETGEKEREKNGLWNMFAK